MQQQGGRPPGGRQQAGAPQSQTLERDPWAELQGEASRAASRGPPPGGFRGGFAGGFQGRSRELLNLKQRQVLTASQLALRNFSTSCSHASSALDLYRNMGTWLESGHSKQYLFKEAAQFNRPRLRILPSVVSSLRKFGAMRFHAPHALPPQNGMHLVHTVRQLGMTQ